MKQYKFIKGSGENDCIYPITQDQMDNLKECRLTNPCVGDNHGIKVPDDFNIEESANEIARVRLEVSKGVFPYWFMDKYYPFKEKFGEFPREIPTALADEGLFFYDPQGLADVVHMDLPTQMPHAVLRWLLESGSNVKSHTDQYVNFLESVPFVEEQISDGTKRGLKKVFEIKYAIGLARPEEVLSDLMNIEPSLFTAYNSGCPTHPSFPQGHMAAAAGGNSAIVNEFNLQDGQLKEILDITYMWGQFRCLAGVHYGVDGVASLVASPFKKYLRKDIIDKYTI